jgi:hypothetical protein
MIVLANSHTAGRIVAFGQLLEQKVATVQTKLLDVHSEIARDAQEATVEAYQTARASLGRNSPAYRPASRYAGGRLEAALSASGFAVATGEGIMFGDVDLLDAAARQWARLNYGAGGDADGGGSRQFRVGLSNLETAAMGIDRPVRPPFMMPEGFWRTSNQSSEAKASGGDEFYPTGITADFTATKGIRAEHWMDAGVKVIAAEVGPAYLNVYKQCWREAKQGAGVDGVDYVNLGGKIKNTLRGG